MTERENAEVKKTRQPLGREQAGLALSCRTDLRSQETRVPMQDDLCSNTDSTLLSLSQQAYLKNSSIQASSNCLSTQPGLSQDRGSDKTVSTYA